MQPLPQARPTAHLDFEFALGLMLELDSRSGVGVMARIAIF